MKQNSNIINNDKILPNELKEFNWSAFLLTFIWGIRFKAPITFLAIPILLINLPMGLNWILYIAFQIYCGINGNKWAYKNEINKSPKEFRITQTKWGIIAIIINIILPIILLDIFINFMQKSPDNLSIYLNNIYCKKVYKNINKGIKKTKQNQHLDSTLFVKRVGQEFKNCKIDDNRIDLNNDYSIYFNIEKNISDCETDKKNCYITSAFKQPDNTYSSTCYFYIDRTIKIIPDSKTENKLKKGYNILKYF